MVNVNDNESIEPLLKESKNEEIISIPFSKYKIKPKYNFMGNFEKYINTLPIELVYYFTNEEYQDIIDEINKIVKLNKTPTILSIIFQLFIIIPLIFFAITNNLPFLYITLVILIVTSFLSVLISFKIQNKTIKILENHLLIINTNYYNKNISFEIEKKYSNISKNCNINLYICFNPPQLRPFLCQSLSTAFPPANTTNQKQQQQLSSFYNIDSNNNNNNNNNI